MDSPNSAGPYNALNAVAAAGPDDVWAAGGVPYGFEGAVPSAFGTTGSGSTHDSSNHAFSTVTHAPATVACPEP